MSKIHKAIQALRNKENQARTADSQSGTAGKLMVGNNKINRQVLEENPLNVQSLGSQELNGLDGALEIVPRSRIEIDFEKLISDGVLPTEIDRDVIEQQFRRIKRPVLQYAFDSIATDGLNENVIMVASALPGAGKTFCAFNLAQSIAAERDVGAVLVDADVLKPGVSKSLGLENNIGLIDYLVDRDLELADILVATDLQDIVIIPAGRKHPEATELLASRRMQQLVSQLSTYFRSRAVIFDTPPLLITNEAQVLGDRVGQIVFVIEARVSSQDSVIRSLSLLNSDKPINAILNKSRSTASAGYHSDDYGYYPIPNRRIRNANEV